MDLDCWPQPTGGSSDRPPRASSQPTNGGSELTAIWPPFAAERHDHPGGVARVRLVGELDLASASSCEAALRDAEQGAQLVLLDLRDLWFLDCTGLRVILDAERRLRESGRRLTVVRGRRPVQRLFELLGVTEWLDMVDDPAAAAPPPSPTLRVAGQGS